MTRRVVLLMGAPGSGKTTLALAMQQAFGGAVLDRDLPPFEGDEDAFRAAGRAIGLNPAADAVVVRTCATAAARATIRRLVAPTEEIVLYTPVETCLHRIRARARGTAEDIVQQQNAARAWWLQRGAQR